jgi:hypothetical protein
VSWRDVADETVEVYTLAMGLYRGFSAPSQVRQKENGMWTFDHCPYGVWEEFCEFPDELTARKELERLKGVWEAENGKGFVVA